MQRHEFWQAFLPAGTAPAAPFTDRFPATLPDGRILMLPIRPLGDTGTAIASLILNQSAFEVESALADLLAERLRPAAPEVVVGLPTLGLSLARLVAQRLGHSRFVALGTSRKFWYDPALSLPMQSITSPGIDKRLFVDPHMVPLMTGRRVVLIDDVISSANSISAALDLLALAGVVPTLVGTAMLQTDRWAAVLEKRNAPPLVETAITSPLLCAVPGGWVPA